MRESWIRRLLPKKKRPTWLKTVLSGSLYKLSDMRGDTSFATIRAIIDTMRKLAADSQISTALSYYATDATTTNTAGQIIWATGKTEKDKEVADIINKLFDRWDINRYVRDHILELATIGNLYLPTNQFYQSRNYSGRTGIGLDSNTLQNVEYDIVASSLIPPEDVLHLWYEGNPAGFIYQPSDDSTSNMVLNFPEESIIHFSLGGLLGKYTIDCKDHNGNTNTYDIQFADPLIGQAVQPTQTLSLLEDAAVLSSLSRVIKFLNVECGTEEEEIRDSLQQIKDAVEQQLSLNTASGDTQSFVNPQSPNNLIYLPRVDGQDVISVTDLDMAEASDADNKLLDYYQNKKLSVLGVPKEALNFSSNEGLGGAGSVLSQRSALYANGLLRLETAYIVGWKDAIDKYFRSRQMSGFVGNYILHMNPIITTQSTIQFEKRDAAISQAQTFVDMLKGLNITDDKPYKQGLREILSEVLPGAGADALGWNMEVQPAAEGDITDAF